MKKLSAILLLALFLFNIAGYRIWFGYAQQQADMQITESIDKDEYNEADLITIKIPINLPYQTDWKNFERVDGEVNIEGKIYKYVKRKVLHGEVVLLCLPDENKTRLTTAKDEFFKYANDLMQHNSSKKSGNAKDSAFKNWVGEYGQCPFTLDAESISGYSKNYSLSQVGAILAVPHLSPEQPPDYCRA